MASRLGSSELYTIAWIAALPIERAAATALLDETHGEPDGFIRHEIDNNAYTWGRIGEHNVVIASLQAGVYGTISAATTASDLISSLPHIRFGLLVGIGGGIAKPEEDQDIRLGDIVVSQPDRETGGVVQYDFGKAKVDGIWEQKGSLNKPPPVLLHALATLQASHEMMPSKIPDLLETLWHANDRFMTKGKRSYTHPGTANDRLYKSEYSHAGGATCSKCDSDWELEREERDSTDPEIHYGTIASGNSLIKDSATRDKLWERQKSLCVEMEASGLMDKFPCLVIRGICDYADSHKNDRWQRYAAATAAAFAVELLGHVPAKKVNETRKVIEALNSIEVKIDTLSVPVQNIDSNIVFGRLPDVEGARFDSYAEEHNSTCLANTRVDLLEELSDWIEDSASKPILWLNGMAGTGKSTIARTIAKSRAETGDLGASFFFKRGEADRESLAKFVPSLARQLAKAVPRYAKIVKETLDSDPDIVSKAVSKQFAQLIEGPLKELLKAPLAKAPLTFVIDALDECEKEDEIKSLIEIISGAISIRQYLRVLITSRPELPIRLGFGKANGTYLPLVLHDMPVATIKHDIRAFLINEFERIRVDFNSTVPIELSLPRNWPGYDDINRLTEMAVPLFIFAATVCRFVSSWKVGSPPEQLQKYLKLSNNNTSGTHLEKTYGPVLRSIVTGVSEEDRRQINEQTCHIVGSIIILANPLSTMAMSKLLDLPVGVVHSTCGYVGKDIRIWRLETGECVHSLNNEGGKYWSPFKLSHDGKWAVATSENRPESDKRLSDVSDNSHHDDRLFLKIWHVDTGKLIGPLAVQYDRQPFQISPDSKLLVLITDTGSAIVLRLDTAGFARENRLAGCEQITGPALLRVHHDPWIVQHSSLYFMEFSPNSSLLTIMSTCADEYAVWETKTFQRIRYQGMNPYFQTKFHPHSLRDRSLSVAVTNNASIMMAGVFSREGDGSMHLEIRWADSAEVISTFDCQEEIRFTQFSLDHTTLVSIDMSGSVRTWRVQTGECLTLFEFESRESPEDIFVSPDFTLLTSSETTKAISVWANNAKETDQGSKKESDPIISVVLSLDRTLAASSSYCGVVKVWNMDTYGCVYEFDEDYQTQTSSNPVSLQLFQFTKDAKYLFLSRTVTRPLTSIKSLDGHFRAWEMTTGDCIISLQSKIHAIPYTSQGSAVSVSLDEHWIFSVRDRNVTFIALDTFSVTRELTFTGLVYDAAVSPNSQFLLVLYSETSDTQNSAWGLAAHKHQEFLLSKFSIDNGVQLISIRLPTVTPGIMAVSSDAKFVVLRTVEDLSEEDGALAVLTDTGESLYQFRLLLPACHAYLTQNDSILALDGGTSLTLRDSSTGLLLRSLKVVSDIRPIRFNFDGNTQEAHTNLGTFALHEDFKDEALPIRLDEHLIGYGISYDGSWLLWKHNKIFWLWPELRPTDISLEPLGYIEVSGSTVIIGTATGRVQFFKFDLHNLLRA
ncbi:hypothetical protein FPCIR_2022 [Fusarium pseudocircinatum]|uniref:NACHT domain-containing protein n=1 Tax=Fusarium pseudocircinatum TaxID=56676 RepID=A0A8H5UWS5_9HYPO|nr:hypothetical protein FPCIR_2022 [Fusarium pseudocircinatum]